jgi:acetyl-CoA carboxylase biotin carboxyl carrier protein
MNQKEIKELIEFLIEKDIAEFELERGDVRLRVKRGGDTAPPVVVSTPAPVIAAHLSAPPAMVSAPAQPSTEATAPAPPAVPEDKDLFIVKSPIVGTFYEAPSPGSPPFVSPGDHVDAGQVLCIIEAMKLMNEIESDVAGEIVKRIVNNGQPVEYGQPLFSIRVQK